MDYSAIQRIGEVNTPIGQASILFVSGQRFLIFPDCIDRNDPLALNRYYGTLCWPPQMSIDDISHFQSGPALPGLLILHLETTEPLVDKMKTAGSHHVRDFVKNVLTGLTVRSLSKS